MSIAHPEIFDTADKRLKFMVNKIRVILYRSYSNFFCFGFVIFRSLMLAKLLIANIAKSSLATSSIAWLVVTQLLHRERKNSLLQTLSVRAIYIRRGHGEKTGISLRDCCHPIMILIPRLTGNGAISSFVETSVPFITTLLERIWPCWVPSIWMPMPVSPTFDLTIQKQVSKGRDFANQCRVLNGLLLVDGFENVICIEADGEGDSQRTYIR